MFPEEPIVAIVKRNDRGQWSRLSEASLETDEVIEFIPARGGVVALVGSIGESDLPEVEVLLKDLLLIE
jgi:hypothetical protein